MIIFKNNFFQALLLLLPISLILCGFSSKEEPTAADRVILSDNIGLSQLDIKQEKQIVALVSCTKVGSYCYDAQLNMHNISLSQLDTKQEKQIVALVSCTKVGSYCYDAKLNRSDNYYY